MTQQKNKENPKIMTKLAPPKRQLIALLAGLLALGLFYLVRGNKPLMNGFIQYFSAPWKRFFGAVAQFVPFSLAELACTVLVVFLLYWIGKTVVQLCTGKKVLAKRLVALCALVVWVYVGVCAFWGVHYYGDSFSDKSGLVAQPLSVQQLEATTRLFAQNASLASRNVQRDEAGRFLGDQTAILAYGDACYAQIVQEYPFLEGPTRTPKPAAYSYLMSLAGFTGYIFPYFGETVLNVHSPTVYLPVTVAHEMAHQRGVAAEQEANFVGISAAITCDNADYQYSGWLLGYAYLSDALYTVSPDAWQAAWDELDEGCKADIRWNNEYWRSMEGQPINTLMQKTYSEFLQGYGQTLGLASYGACVDLLVARYCPIS